MTEGVGYPDIRVFGGFDPDEAIYDYGRDLPVAVPAYYFTVKASIPIGNVQSGGRGTTNASSQETGRGRDAHTHRSHDH